MPVYCQGGCHAVIDFRQFLAHISRVPSSRWKIDYQRVALAAMLH